MSGDTTPAVLERVLAGDTKGSDERLRQDALTISTESGIPNHFQSGLPRPGQITRGLPALTLVDAASAPKVQEGAGSYHHVENDPVINKIMREAVVLGGGLGEGIFYGLANLPEKLPKIAASVAIGAALNAISKTGTMGTAAAFIVGGYFTSRFILNTINDTERWGKFGAAVSDTWHSNKNTLKNMHTVAETGGEFAFDTGLSMAAGYMGYTNKTLADLVLKVIKLPLPASPTAIPPILINVQMALDIVPPIYTRYKPRTAENERLSLTTSELLMDRHGSLNRLLKLK